jgi:agmatine deiminase
MPRTLAEFPHRLFPVVFATIALLAAVAVVPPVLAGEPAQSTMDRWEWDVDHIAKQLPSWETPEERAAWGDRPFVTFAIDPPPLQPIRNVAEYEPMTKVLIRYPLGLPYAVIREMDENVEIACIVSSSSLTTARNNFQANGIDPNTVDWVIAPSDSYWTRDYGPWFVFDGNGDIRIIDHYYNRPARPNDNAIPIVCGAHWGIPVHTHDLWHTGGNYMTDGYGISFSTDLVWDENSSMSHLQIFQRMHDYYGLQTFNVMTDDLVSYIRHIDCWAKTLDEETIIVKQVATTHPDYSRLEQNATLMASLPSATGRNYHVVRVYCQSIGGNDVAGYTNSLILNKKILVPTFNSPTNDNNALQAYRNAVPGYEVIGSYYSGWLTDDALHCRAIGIADPGMLRVAHIPIVGWDTYTSIPVRAFIDDRSEAGLKSDSLLVYWRAYPTGQTPPSFSVMALAADSPADWYQAEIPAQADGTTVDYYIHAVDTTNRREGMPRTEPAGWYSFRVTLPAAGIAGLADNARATLEQNAPNPFREGTTFSFELKYEDRVELGLYDPQGRLVRTLVDGQVGPGRHLHYWDGRDEAGRDVAAGVYFYRLKAAGVSYTRRAVLAK